MQMMKKSESLSNSLFPPASESVLIDALFESIGDGAVATDQFGKITRVNSVALQILGFRKREVLGKWFPAVIVSVNENNEPSPLLDRPITEAFMTGHSVSENTYYRHKDGHVIPTSVTVSPLILNNRPVGAINLFRDRTQEYEIDRMKSEFISLASHQLRTPLSSIKTYAHMLIDGYMGELSVKQQEALQNVVEATERMNQLNNTLLNITRIETGVINISKKLVDLNKVIKNILKEHRMHAAAKKISLEYKPHKKSLKVITDEFILEEMISNLISNALKYTPDGGSVVIDTQKKRSNVICRVSDTGAGIPKSSHHQIFNKFFRAPNVVDHDTTGTGLGLYLVKRLADQLGIKVWFESEVDKGSTFYLSLPAKD
jgi:PAS domain S-box-containing protein